MVSRSKNSATNKAGIKTTSDIHEADMAIFFNTYSQLTLYLLGFLVFFFLRRKLTAIYATNPRKKKKHPAYNKNGYFNWVKPLFTISDIDLININGLDCYVMLSLFRIRL